jgi:hypothetical protein
MITAQSLRIAASEVDDMRRTLNLAVAEAAEAKARVKALEDEREAYFKPRVDGDISCNVLRDEARQTLRIRANVGNAVVSCDVGLELIYSRMDRADLVIYTARNIAGSMADLIARKIAPMLAQDMSA